MAQSHSLTGRDCAFLLLYVRYKVGMIATNYLQQFHHQRPTELDARCALAWQCILVQLGNSHSDDLHRWLFCDGGVAGCSYVPTRIALIIGFVVKGFCSHVVPATTKHGLFALAIHHTCPSKFVAVCFLPVSNRLRFEGQEDGTFRLVREG